MVHRSGMPRSRRLVTGALVLAIHAGLGALLLRPMMLPVHKPVETLVMVNVPAPPPPAPEAETPAPPAPTAQAAPPAPRRKPRPVAAPVPPAPSPAPVAEAPSTGTETAAGAAASGAGTGAAGTGVGAASGSQGTGSGGGAKPRWRSGRIDRRDYPADASRAGATGSVTVTLDITPDGRVSGCTVVRSSGTPSLDRTTCRLIEQRFRFNPARDPAGNPVPGVAGWRQDWWLEPPR